MFVNRAYLSYLQKITTINLSGIMVNALYFSHVWVVGSTFLLIITYFALKTIIYHMCFIRLQLTIQELSAKVPVSSV